MIKKNKPILYDPLIIPRVKQYLEENVHQTYVDVSVMARQLQERYREYNRRKSGPFRNLVEQAYKTVLHSYGLDSNPSSEDDDGNSELEMMEDNSMSNHMNNMLTNLYSKNKNSDQSTGAPIASPTAGTNSTTNEAIDISSDESGDDNLSNGKGTKQTTTVKFRKEVSLTKVPHSDIMKNDKIKTLTLSGLEVPPLVGSLKLPQTDKQIPTFPPQPLPQSNSRRDGVANNNVNPNIQQHKKRKFNEHHKMGSESKKVIYSTSQHNNNGTTDNIRNTNTGKLPPLTNIFSQNLQTRLRKFKKEVNIQHAQFTFQNMGGIERVLKELCELLFHYRNPQIYLHIGLSAPRGLLLHGPPGCGKTMLAEAIAGTLEVPFINVPATELIAGVSGESEERIREMFEQAAIHAPCVLFIDEIDAISSNRINAQRDMERRIVAQLISSLDGLEDLENGDLVLVVGATNRPDNLDPALRRVGRFDHEIALGIPDRNAREEILRVICDKLLLEPSFKFDKIAEITPGYVGADLFALAFRAASIAIKRKYFNQMRIRQAEDEMYIPIVDLLEESSDVHRKLNTLEINKKDDNINTEPENQNENQSEANKDNEKTSSENNILGIRADSVIIPSDEEEKMEIDDEKSKTEIEKVVESDKNSTENTNIEEPKKRAEESDTNKVEELGEKNVSIVSVDICEDEIPDSASIKKTVKTKKDPSLLELLKWLRNDSISIEDSDLRDLCLTMADFQEAVKLVQPSAKREGFITVPDVTWSDIGSLQNIREELQLAVLAPVKFPEKLNALGLSAPSGILLCGPPGCGKTLLAKAVANEAGINFISVKGPELMNMYVGESERAVRTCFQRARNSAPCVIFFDEFDSLCPKRSDSNESGSGTRIVNQLLTEMDGIEDRKGVYLLAATNRPDIIDPAILRPGRLDTILYVGLPEAKDRIEILHALTKNRTKPVLAEDVDLTKIGNLTTGYTGADLAGLLRQASLLALKESLTNPLIKPEDLKLCEKHFENALNLTKPSVNEQDRKIYEQLRLKYAAPRNSEIVE